MKYHCIDCNDETLKMSGSNASTEFLRSTGDDETEPAVVICSRAIGLHRFEDRGSYHYVVEPADSRGPTHIDLNLFSVVPILNGNPAIGSGVFHSCQLNLSRFAHGFSLRRRGRGMPVGIARIISVPLTT
jgi:hypothetical protein